VTSIDRAAVIGAASEASQQRRHVGRQKQANFLSALCVSAVRLFLLLSG
jgi:hypothetical protein